MFVKIESELTKRKPTWPNFTNQTKLIKLTKQINQTKLTQTKPNQSQVIQKHLKHVCILFYHLLLNLVLNNPKRFVMSKTAAQLLYVPVLIPFEFDFLLPLFKVPLPKGREGFKYVHLVTNISFQNMDWKTAIMGNWDRFCNQNFFLRVSVLIIVEPMFWKRFSADKAGKRGWWWSF